MGRSAQFTDQQFVWAAQATIAEEGAGALTVQKVAARAGATTGSVYHRFDSLDAIAATAWLSAAEQFQRDFAASLAAEAGSLYQIVLAGALHTPAWSRRHLVQARLLLRLDVQDLNLAPLSDPLRRRVQKLGRGLRRTLLPLARRHSQRGASEERLRLLQFLLADMPLAAVKPYLKRGQKPPAAVDAIIARSVAGFENASELS